MHLNVMTRLRCRAWASTCVFNRFPILFNLDEGHCGKGNRRGPARGQASNPALDFDFP